MTVLLVCGTSGMPGLCVSVCVCVCVCVCVSACAAATQEVLVGLCACVHCAAATQEALVERYNDQLRELREAGLTEQAEEIREVLRDLRDEERAPEASVKVPFSCHLTSAR